MSEYLQVQTTTDSREDANRLARGVVEARLAACVQTVGPVTSTYWWEEQVQQDEEFLLLMKIDADRYDDLAEYLTENHSYAVPELIAISIVEGGADYLSWISEETQEDHPSRSE